MTARIEGLNPLLRTFRNFDKSLSKELRVRAKAIAEPIAEDARARARSPQERMVAPSIRAVSDRIPVIKAGGGKRLASNTPRRVRPQAGAVFFGADFGARTNPRFPRKKDGGRLLFPAVKDNRTNIAKQYLDAVDDVFGDRNRGR